MISQVATLNKSDIMCPKQGSPIKYADNRHGSHEKWSECTLAISYVS